MVGGTISSLSVIPGYEIKEALSEGREAFGLYRGIRQKDQKSFLIKVPTSNRPSQKTLLELENELKVAKVLDSTQVVRPLRLERHFDKVVLFLEDCQGKSLERLLGEPSEIEYFLKLSISIVGSLIEIHQNRIVHRDIKPQSILVNTQTTEGKLFNFGKASLLPHEQSLVQNPNLIEGTLPYISPEQTGRMNRFIDYRTDLYSLGVVFYQMLSGRLPFEAEDPLGWVYCHIAQTPKPLHEIVPTIPQVISDIVIKLLAKAAEDRYQSAFGLKTDLEKCLDQWNSHKLIYPFPLGEKDVPELMEISQRLYGREKEFASLVQTFDQVLATGVPQLLLVSGYSGIGKSSLVNELHRTITRDRGVFIREKFDLKQRNIPYLTLVKAFRELILELLTETSNQLQVWKSHLSEALGAHAQLIIDLIPELELILGKQLPISELPLAEAQNRFQVVFHRFVQVFAKKEHPLVLFLDDLQWADPASLKMLHHLVSHQNTPYLLLLGAYRDNEITPFHPLMLTLDEIRKSSTQITHIVLQPLSPLDLQQLIADTLHSSLVEVKAISDLIHSKTGGNPFFTVQLLTALYHKQLIEFDSRSRKWRWDFIKIQSEGFTANVLDLLIAKLKNLPLDSQGVLSHAACIGNQVDVPLLAVICEQTEENIHKIMFGPLRENLITLKKASYRFIHDKVQQAAYLLIPEDQRAAMHLRIGRLFLSQTPLNLIEAQVFYIVSQFNLGRSLITSEEEKENAAHLNLIAGTKAKYSTAYVSAIEYLSSGIELLRPDSWEAQYDLTYSLYFEQAECEFLSGRFNQAEQLLSLLLKNARSRTQKAAILKVKVQLRTLQGQVPDAVKLAIEFLEVFGIYLLLHPTREEVISAIEKIGQNLGKHRIEELINLPAMADPEKREIIDILSILVEPASFLDNNLFCLLLSQIVNMSIQFGNSEHSSVGYVLFGMMLGPAFGKYEEGYRFGELGYDLTEKWGLDSYKSKVYLCFSQVINPWTQKFSINHEILKKAVDAAIEVGDLFSACSSYIAIITFLISKGDCLSEILKESEKALAFIRKSNFEFAEHVVTSQLRFIQNLRGLTLNFHTFSASQFDEVEYESQLNRGAYQSVLGRVDCWYYFVWKLQARFMSGDYEVAIESASRAKDLLWTSNIWLEMIDYYYYTALAMAAQHVHATPDKKEFYRVTLEEHRDRLKELADHCHETIFHKFALVSAEVSRLKGRPWEAVQLYEEGIQFAKKNGFIQHEGIGYELASRFYEDQNLELVAEAYRREARSCYVRWEAYGKVRAMDELYPHLREVEMRTQSTTTVTGSEQLDLLAVVKASQAISGEICLESLIKKLIQVVVEQSGAEKAVLILSMKGELFVKAIANVGQDGLEMNIQEAPVELSTQVPISMVNYVWRTKQRVVCASGRKEKKFTSDNYIERVQPLSVLCFPIVWQSSIIGLLYLENNHFEGAFTLDRLEVLELLATQAAIAIENAILYSNMSISLEKEKKAVEMRDEFISIASHELRTPLTPLRLQVQFMERILQHPALLSLPESKQFTQIVKLSGQQIDRFSRLVENLLDVSRISSGQMLLKKECVDLRQLVNEKVKQFASDLQRSGSQVELRMEAPVTGSWDKFRIEQVIDNLISNAIKYGRGTPIQVTVLNGGKTANLIVKDSGMGVSKEAQSRVFDRFERGASIQNFGGLGLGLYITRQIILAHSGNIRVDSEVDQGATFTVELPL